MVKILRLIASILGVLLIVGLAGLGGYQIYQKVWPDPIRVGPRARPALIDWQTTRAIDPPHGVIVFVHGVGGKAIESWKNASNVTWPALMAADPSLKNYDICEYSYDSSLDLDRDRIEDIVGELRQRLDGELSKYYHLVIVSHSMGGIVARNALADSNLARRPWQTATLVTCGTPFKGSDWVDVLKLISPSESQYLQLLSTASGFRKITDDQWEHMRRACGPRLFHFAACEKKKLGQALIVDSESARWGADDSQDFDDSDHSTLVKPADNQAPVFLAVKSLILGREQGLIKRREAGPIAGEEENRIVFPQLPKGTRAPRRNPLLKDEIAPNPVYVLGPGPVDVDVDIRIPGGVDLVIEPGTSLNFRGNAVLDCQGRLHAGRPPNPSGTPAGAPPNAEVIFDFRRNAEKADGAVYLRGPLAQGSALHRCRFLSGRGIGLNKPNPRDHEQIDWTLMTRRDLTAETTGGALLLVGVTDVELTDCRFSGNRAWTGGAIAAYGADRVRLRRCRFEGNLSGFGGGALFLQASEFYLWDCQFIDNETGQAYRPKDVKAKVNSVNACGGGLYMGLDAHAELRGCDFVRNHAAYVGGACYFLNTDYHTQTRLYESIVQNCTFIENRADNEAGGGAVFLDGSSRFNVTNVHFILNHGGGAAGHPSAPTGRDVVDASRFSGIASGEQSGLTLNDQNVFVQEGVEPTPSRLRSAIALPANVFAEEAAGTEEGMALNSQAAVSRRAVNPPRVIPVVSSPMKNKRSYGQAEKRRGIDTVVIHHISAINWEDPKFQSEFAAGISDFEKSYGQLPGRFRKYDWRYCKQILEFYGFSSHYLIDRQGTIRRLVPEGDIAYHAGESRMPAPDGRESVNRFSIGIELIASHEDDDPEVASGREAYYTNEQYQSLGLLLLDLSTRYKIPEANIVGHDDIAPKRKKDPGGRFDWKNVKQALRARLKRWQADS
jgi:pimeloyl-ACP methyl ester carboxylesterase